jgi:hypothetical protein
MPEQVVVMDRLIVRIGDARRLPTGVPGMDRVELDVTFENRVGPLDAVSWPPAVELRAEGGVYPAMVDDRLAGPLEPNSERQGYSRSRSRRAPRASRS